MNSERNNHEDQPRKRRGRPPKPKAEGTLAERGATLGIGKSGMHKREAKGLDLPLAQKIQVEQHKKLKLENAKLRAVLAVLEGETIYRSVAEEHGVAIAEAQNAYSAAIRSELPPLLAGLSEAQVEAELVRFTDRWDARMADERDSLWAKAREAVARELRGDLKKAARARQNGNGGEE